MSFGRGISGEVMEKSLKTLCVGVLTAAGQELHFFPLPKWKKVYWQLPSCVRHYFCLQLVIPLHIHLLFLISHGFKRLLFKDGDVSFKNLFWILEVPTEFW